MHLLDYLAKISASIHARGFLGATKIGLLYGLGPLVMLRPVRVRRRLGDWMYDRLHGVDTSRIVGLAALRSNSPNLPTATRYEPTPMPRFRSLLERLGVAFENFTFVDYGSGKGKCLLMASEFPFARIVGVDFSPFLTDIARQNIARYDSGTQRCTSIDVVQADAVDYMPPAGNLVCYFYHPFARHVVQHVHDALAERTHGEVRVIYYNPIHRAVFDRSRNFAIVDDASDCCVYRLNKITRQGW